MNTDFQIAYKLAPKTARIITRLPAQELRNRSAYLQQARLLLCLPFDQAHFYSALKIFLPVIRQYPTLTRLIVPQAFFPLIKEIDPDILIPLIDNKIDSQGFPTDPAVLALTNADLAVAVDLNVTPTVLTAYIVYRSRARIKVAFQSECSENLFNLIINFKTGNLAENAYKRIWNLIQPEILKTQ
ncbi:MAG: hypothetical protein PHC43_03965 [Candidatus Marinimicrobia bacterium]|nr:hypothetical protein [Candidatus Neomarinimicrobiota bacterium]MDD5539556.1 hypothetical protein [Candidatus Neomarinimicrobiota bacterium]